jgi:proline dehydrogenase
MPSTFETDIYSPNFIDTKTAFACKDKKALQRAHFLFNAMQSKTLVKLGSAAIKTSFSLHLPVSGIIKNTIYKQFCGGETIEEALETAHELQKYKVKAVLDYAAEGGDSDSGYNNVTNQVLYNIGLAALYSEVKFISLKMTGIGSNHILEKLNLGWQLNADERRDYQQIKARLNKICKAAQEANVIIYIDAEESWLQNPIDVLAEEMMRCYNKYKPVVFNTLQMYRVDQLAYCQYLIDDARQNNYISGIKIVRGAYREKETLRAQQRGYKNPVFTVKQQSDDSFNGAINLCLNNLDVCALCAATHNEQSVGYLLQEFEKRGLHAFANRIFFSQLYGMSDNLTFNLAKSGWEASKYLPYGEVKTAIPYLLRRAEENTSIAGQTGRELSLLKQEIKRRKAEQLL